MKALPNIREFRETELIEKFNELQIPAFRAKQVYDWLWHKQMLSFDGMSNLSLALREQLKATFSVPTLLNVETQKSNDGTLKNAFTTHDGKVIEGVLIPTEKRITACISSQVGCSLTCKFCATGKLTRLRNLRADEIFDQVVAIKNQAEQVYQRPLTNIVYMGMGEPLLNYNNVLHSVDLICSEKGLGMSPKRITVSTAGISKLIKKLGDDKVKFNLALSLHAANDEKRSHIMPINEQNNLKVLADAIKHYYNCTQQMVTFEYIIFRDFNDTIKDAEELMRFCGHVPSKVNIIEYNPIDNGEFQQAAPEKVDAFADFLTNRGITVKVRRSRGKDIDAACGQLANKNNAAKKVA